MQKPISNPLLPLFHLKIVTQPPTQQTTSHKITHQKRKSPLSNPNWSNTTRVKLIPTAARWDRPPPQSQQQESARSTLPLRVTQQLPRSIPVSPALESTPNIPVALTAYHQRASTSQVYFEIAGVAWLWTRWWLQASLFTSQTTLQWVLSGFDHWGPGGKSLTLILVPEAVLAKRYDLDWVIDAIGATVHNPDVRDWTWSRGGVYGLWVDPCSKMLGHLLRPRHEGSRGAIISKTRLALESNRDLP